MVKCTKKPTIECTLQAVAIQLLHRILIMGFFDKEDYIRISDGRVLCFIAASA